MSGVDDLVVRRTSDADLPAILALLADSLGWHRDDRHERLFRWKHHDNPFGPSPTWAAFAGERLVALRVLMRWEFTDPDGRVVRAVRAVDTATAADFRGRGLFRTLTLAAVEELTREGVDLVFNTPNDQSRPGYLKMGWREVGRLPVRARPAGPVAAARLVRARVPAELWSQPAPGGEEAAEVLAEDRAIEELLAARPRPSGLATRLDAEVLRWRYGTPLLGYRAVVAPGGPARGLAIFRCRRRGPVTEAAVGLLVVPGDDRRTHRRLRRQILTASGAQVAVTIGGPGGRGWWPLPGAGPLLVARRLRTDPPSPGGWSLTLGDIELF